MCQINKQNYFKETKKSLTFPHCVLGEHFSSAQEVAKNKIKFKKMGNWRQAGSCMEDWRET